MTEKSNRKLKAEVLQHSEVAAGVRELSFKCFSTSKFVPGQYLWLPLKNSQGEESLRAFSIANIPSKDNVVSILYKPGESEYKQLLANLKPGDLSYLYAPFGSAFAFPEDEDIPVVLLAGGVGVSPFLSLARSLVFKPRRGRVLLVYAERNAESVVYREELEKLSRDIQGLSVKFVLGEVGKHDLSEATRFTSGLVYISGPQGFVDAASELCRDLGVQKSHLRFEALYPSFGQNQGLNKLFSKGKLAKKTESGEVYHEEQLSLLVNIINSSTNHIVVTDSEGRVVYANDAAQKLTEFSLEEMLGQTPRLWGGLMSPEFYQRLWQHKLEGTPIREKIVNRAKSGRLYQALANIAPIYDTEKNLIGWIGTEEDITSLESQKDLLEEQRKDLENTKQALINILEDVQEERDRAEKLKERFVLATDSARIGVWEWDVKKNELIWDKNMYLLYGIPEEKFGGAYEVWKDGLHPDDRETSDQAIKLALEGVRDFDTIFRVVWPSGEVRFIKAKALVKRNPAGEPEVMVGVNWDVTHEQEVDRAKSEFVSLASHQLRTPLSTISWYSEMLLAGDAGKLTSVQEEYLHEVYKNSTRMTELVNALLNVSRLELGTFVVDPMPVDLEKLAEEEIQSQLPALNNKKLHLEKVFDWTGGPVSVDPKLMRIVFQNYLSNAIKYTPEGGKLVFGITKPSASEFKDLDLGPEGLLFYLKDNGMGIPKSQQSKIFAKLFRADNVRKVDADGTGLGLYIVKSILEQSKGKAWFTSEEGQGSVFYAYLPKGGMVRKDGSKKLS